MSMAEYQYAGNLRLKNEEIGSKLFETNNSILKKNKVETTK